MTNIDTYTRSESKLSKQELELVKSVLEENGRKANAPRVGQRFRYYSFVPATYEVKKVENNIVYYSVVGEEYLSKISIDDFLDEKKNNNIWYV